MSVKSVEELQVYQKSLDAGDALFAIVQRGTFRSDLDMERQLMKGARRIPSDISEGFEQKTDVHFAHYLYIARGAAREICSQMAVARRRGLVSDSQRFDIVGRYDEIARMLTGLIKYLEDSDWDHRG